MPAPLSFLIDENLRGELLRRLSRHLQANPGLQVSALQVGDTGAPACGTLDHELLAWCVEHGYGLVSNDRRTLPGFVQERLAKGLPTPAVFLLKPDCLLREVVETLVILAEASAPNEWQGRILWIPL